MELSGLLENPDWYLYALESSGATFTPMSREHYRRSIFLDRRLAAQSDQRKLIAYDKLAEALGDKLHQPSPVSYIFTMAHCGSTLLSRALDVESGTLVCREPLPLRQLAVEYVTQNAAQSGSGDWRARLELVTSLLGRGYQAEAPTIVKANVPVNFILDEILSTSATPLSVFVYFPLERYLLAVLRTPKHRQWVKNVCEALLPAIKRHAPVDANTPLAQLAAGLWLSQVRSYSEAMTKYAKTVSLDGEEFLNTPKPVLRKAFSYFKASVSEEQQNSILNGELFSHHSKMPNVPFDNAKRLEIREGIRKIIQPELDQAREWVEAVAKDNPLPEKLSRPLHGDAPALLA